MTRTGAAGERLGSYTSLGPLPELRHDCPQIRLRCDCGKTTDVLLSHWRNSPPRSCVKCARKRSPFGNRLR